jgi:hypothetical protein
MDNLAKRFGPSRVRVLNSQTLLSSPANTLVDVGRFFNLPLTPGLAEVTANGPVFNEHAKEFGRPFNAAAQQAQYDEAGATHRDELAMAKDWARALAIRCNAPLVLTENLSV